MFFRPPPGCARSSCACGSSACCRSGVLLVYFAPQRSGMASDIEVTIKRIQSHKGVVGEITHIFLDIQKCSHVFRSRCLDYQLGGYTNQKHIGERPDCPVRGSRWTAHRQGLTTRHSCKSFKSSSLKRILQHILLRRGRCVRFLSLQISYPICFVCHRNSLIFRLVVPSVTLNLQTR